MSTIDKDFKVKNGLSVTGNGSFGGTVSVDTPTLPEHAATKAYVDSVAGSGYVAIIDGGGVTTTSWSGILDGGQV